MTPKSNREILEKIDKSTKAIRESSIDQLIYGVSILEKNEDGTLSRIDPNSDEGQEILKKGKT